MSSRFSLPTCALGLLLLAGLAGCDFEQALDQLARQGKADTSQTAAAQPSMRASDAIRIASFNIQVFGASKMDKPEVVDALAQVVRQFDVVAIQEIRCSDQTMLPRFVEIVNAAGARYDHVIGPRLGRTSSKEQYAFIFDTTRVQVDMGSVYTVPDPADLLHRPPLVTRFRVRGPPAGEAFSFTLVNIHTDPDETDTELDALADVFTSVQYNGSGEDDVILLGDLNVDYKHLGRLGQLADIDWVIADETTNTRRNRSYDNLVYNRRATVERTGAGGVLDLMRTFGLTMDEALKISDHMPVWAEFSIYEGGAGSRIATRPADAEAAR